MNGMVNRSTPIGPRALRARLISGSLWAFGGQTITVAAAFGANVLLARLLAPSDMGLYFLAFSLASSVSVVAQLGLNKAVIRLVAEAIGSGNPRAALAIIRKVFRIGTLSAILIAGLLVTGAGEWIALHLFNSSQLADSLVPIALWTIVLSIRSLQAETFRGFHDIRAATVLGDALSRTVLLAMLAVLWRVKGGAALKETLWLSIGAATATLVCAAAFLKQKTNRLGASPPTCPAGGILSFAQILSISWPLLITGVTVFVLTQVDLWVIGAYRSHDELAIYGVAARLVLIVAMPFFVINNIVAPTIAELYAQNRRRELELLLRTTATWSGLPSVAVLLAFVIGGNWILGAFYGAYYRQSDMILTVLCFGQLTNVWAGSCAIVLMMTGHQATMMRVTLFSGLVVLAGDIAVVRPWGIFGVAVVTVAGMALQNVLLVVLTKRKTGIRTQIQISLLRPSIVLAWLFGR